ncbi:hypothetical protein CC1G_12506 [Coprinopsis cinerea okayama7|uniref:F-box domain-containing protein n=1 Tax=Coprinopsis cinerea (strain Okayama-7 / 130 / ATCC MYA-4618 / FGSC 9003) TaxID=240176 RepID=A8PAF3_COPC7|nr:hypothetical protein CC1G_12506 [Coprinopsis cinerea okayama7\|eukprot:XP_001839977.2 hypothetical protein CC1G_12506 [Coprinopsis cinerea okayama7\
MLSKFLGHVFSRLTELESLRLESTFESWRIQQIVHRPGDLFGPIISPNLRRIELIRMCERFPKLDALALIQCYPWTLPVGDPGEKLQTKELVYETNLPCLDKVIDAIAPGSLRHFHFASNVVADRLRAIELLSASASNLTSFTYEVPEWSSGGIHTKNTGLFLLCAGQNIPVWSSLVALKTFKFQINACDIVDDLAYTGTRYTPLHGFMVSSLISDAVAAIPNLTTLEIKIVAMWNVLLCHQLDKEWKTIEEYLLGRPLRHLQKLRLHLSMIKELWREQGGLDEETVDAQVGEAVQAAFGRLSQVGVAVEAKHTFE